jgi:hypothetical protein
MGEVGQWLRERAVEIGDRFPLSAVQVAFDVVDEDVATPAVLDGLPDVPFTLNGIF